MREQEMRRTCIAIIGRGSSQSVMRRSAKRATRGTKEVRNNSEDNDEDQEI